MNENTELANYLERVQNNICPALAKVKAEFQSSLEDIFDRFIKCDEQQRCSEWIHMKRFYNDCKYQLGGNLWLLRGFCVFVLKLFSKFNCEDEQFVMEIIHVYHQVLNEYKTFRSRENGRQLNYPLYYYYEELVDVRSILKKVNEITNKTYGFTNRELYSKFTIDAIYQGDSAFLQFLVKYGLTFFPEDEWNQTGVELDQLAGMYHYLKSLEGNDSEKNELVGTILKRLFTDSKKRLRRMILVVRAVNISLYMRLGDELYPDYANCFNFCALTVPEAAISVKDVEDFLHLAFPGESTFVSETCSSFKGVFPESAGLSSPRSLKHLCRCRVRDSIQKRPLFPTIVSDLQIPKHVKDYLLFLTN